VKAGKHGIGQAARWFALAGGGDYPGWDIPAMARHDVFRIPGEQRAVSARKDTCEC